MKKRKGLVKSKKRKLQDKLERRVCGLCVMGNEVHDISMYMGISIKQVKRILARKKVEKCLPRAKMTGTKKSIIEEEYGIGLDNVSALLTKIGEEKLTAIIRARAREVMIHGACTDYRQ